MDKELQIEEWRPIVGYEGLYEVSNFGNVRSLDRLRKGAYGKLQKCYGKAIKGTNRKGYIEVGLCNNGKYSIVGVHRLVASAFIPNPNNLPCVNHKDENKTNNFVENLEWCNYSYNNNYGNRNNKVRNKLKNNQNRSKHILQYSLDGKLIKEWPSIKEIVRNTGFSEGNIYSCRKGAYKQAYGYVWKDFDNNDEIA